MRKPLKTSVIPIKKAEARIIPFGFGLDWIFVKYKKKHRKESKIF